MIAANAISQHSTDSAALDACIAAGVGVCGGVAYNPGVAASIQWSARQTGSTFTMNGVTFWPFTGCRRRQLQEIDENDPIYQQSIAHMDNWWQAPYATWLAAQAHNATGRRLSYLPDFEDDHMSPTKARALILRRRAAAGPLWGQRERMDPNERL